jgi:hypothetical protein
MEEKDIYTLKELFDNLPISLAELLRRSQMSGSILENSHV